jgi:FKBP-type peptidyl-prolyl cis-trans isomerase FklB
MTAFPCWLMGVLFMGGSMRFASVLLLGLGMLSGGVYAADDTSSQSLTGNQTQMAPALKDINKAKGEAYLKENKKHPRVVTLPDGLQYIVITQGKGKQPKDQDIVSVDYVGTLIDGKEFDNSYKRGQPATFPVNGVIAGWTEALKLMKVGSKWKLFIPANLAYGEEGAPPVIGPNETLVFEVTLHEIKKTTT